MENPQLAAPGWHPRLVDYVYVSFTNSIAFSPTDAMPLSRWAKLLMLFESGVSALTVLARRRARRQHLQVGGVSGHADLGDPVAADGLCRTAGAWYESSCVEVASSRLGEVMGSARSVYTGVGLDWYAGLPASPAARIGDLLVVSGQVPLDDEMNVVGPGDLVAQTRYVFESIGRLLEAAGATFDDVVDVIAFTQEPATDRHRPRRRRRVLRRDYPAWSIASFLGSYVPGVLVSVQVDRASRAGDEGVLHAGVVALVGIASGLRRLQEGRLAVRVGAVGDRRRRQRPLSGRPLRAGACVVPGDPRDRRHGRRLRRRHPRLHLVPPGPARCRGNLHGRLHARGARRRALRRAGAVDEPRRHAWAREAGTARRLPCRRRPLAGEAHRVHAGAQLVEERPAARRRREEGERHVRDRRGPGRLRRRTRASSRPGTSAGRCATS